MTTSSFLIILLILAIIFLFKRLRSDWREIASLKFEINRVQSDFDLFKKKESNDRKDLIGKLDSINGSYKTTAEKEAKLRKTNEFLDNEINFLKKNNLELTEKLNSIANDCNAILLRESELKINYSTLSANFSDLTLRHFESKKEAKTAADLIENYISREVVQQEKYDLLLKDNQELKSKYSDLIKYSEELRVKNYELENHVKTLDDLEAIKRNLEVFEIEHDLAAAGLYPLYVPYETPDELKAQLEEKRVKLAELIKSKKAAICNTKWTIDDSVAEGTKATKHYIRIMLRTFNADADACMDMVRWNNFEKCVARIKTSFDYVNKLGESHDTYIQPEYLQLRVEQLELMYRYKETQHQHKESMRAARAAAAEERRAQRELENARQAAEQEELRYTRALDKARSELQSLVGHEHFNMLERIKELESELSKAVELKQRAISMAQITKAGFVYVVSNIGSFGSDVLKIGMTRRIDPNDRVRELGGASVPFGFDVHAMIYSEDAPNLENRFHRHFSRQRINLANGRKEFFRVPLTDVVKFAETMSLKAEFTSDVEAKDFRLSDELRRTVLTKLTDDELQERIEATVTDVPDEDEIEDENE